MRVILISLLVLFYGCTKAQTVMGVMKTMPAIPTPAPAMVVMGLESTGGGQNNISTLSDLEKTVNPKVQLFDVVDFDGFQSLHIGVNNNRDHFNLTPLVNVGWHTQFSNRQREGSFLADTLYLVEGAQGGSTIAQWNEGGTYYTKLIARIDAARAFIYARYGLYPVMFFPIGFGINDAITETPVATFKAGYLELLGRLRTRYGNFPLMIMELPPSFHATEDAYNAALVEIASEIGNAQIVATSDATLQDSYHWDKAGNALVTDRIVSFIIAHYNAL